MSTAYFKRLPAGTYQATKLTGGVWNPTQLHIAPLLGILAHESELAHTGSLQLASFHCDILGTIPIGEIAVEAKIVRPGATIELIEVTATPVGDDRPAAIARVWFLVRSDTSEFEDVTGYGTITPRAAARPLVPGRSWTGSFLESIQARVARIHRGHNHAWLRASHDLLAGEHVSPTARMIGLVDMANGVNTVGNPSKLAYPNVDIAVNILRAPRSDWTGFSTRTGFAATGIGLNATTLFDDHGVVGTVAQTLTLRPR